MRKIIGILLSAFLVCSMFSSIYALDITTDSMENLAGKTLSAKDQFNLNPDNKEISTENGQIIVLPADDRIAPLQVDASAVGNRMIYYVYLKDNSLSSKNNMSFIVHGGDICEVYVPLGRYSIYYGCGPKWYGRGTKFGDAGQYYKFDEVFRFYKDAQYVNGHTFTLFPVIDGNMDIVKVDENEFPN